MPMPTIEQPFLRATPLGLSRFAKWLPTYLRVGLLFLFGWLTCCGLSVFIIVADAQSSSSPSVGQPSSSNANANANQSAQPGEALSNSQTNKNANQGAQPGDALSNSQTNKIANDNGNRNAVAELPQQPIPEPTSISIKPTEIQLSGFPPWSIWAVLGTLLIGFLLYYAWIRPRFYNQHRRPVTILRVSLAFLAAGLLIYGGIWIGNWLSVNGLGRLQTGVMAAQVTTPNPVTPPVIEFKPSTVIPTVVPAAKVAAVVSETYRLPDVVSPGQVVLIVGKFEQGKTVAAKIYPLGSTIGTDAQDANAVQGQASIKLPDKLAPGRYVVDLIYDGAAAERVPGELRVGANAVSLDSAYPTTAYRNAKGGFDFYVIGQNFNVNVPKDNQIYISGRGPIIQSWSPDKQGCDNGDQPCLWVESPEKLHVVGYKAESYQGPLTFSVQVGTAARSPEKKLTLSRMSETGVLLWSIGIFLILAYIIYRLVAAGMRDNVIRGKRYSPFWAFFIDKQTNSYSLSKFQFLLFSSVFVFGYLYVFLCRWLVQWQFVLPDVPGSFTGILAISAGTTLASAAATAARGSKGAGPMGPTAADFICSGGQVIPERFQFFVWTLVACIGFLALLISQDPATVEKFPSFPEGLLYVMGVSAGGYLGGKLARPTGPVIRNIVLDKRAAASPPDGSSVITIQGENLSKEADFSVDGKLLPIVPDAGEKLLTGTAQEQATDRSFCSELKITIDPAAGLDLSTGDHSFRIINKDGQFADTRFTADPPVIEKVLEQPPLTSPPSTPEPNTFIANTSDRPITVTGSGFREGTLARWKPPNAPEPIELMPAAVKFVDSGKLEITLVPGDKKGTGTLVLVTPNGFSAVATVTVV